MWSSTPCPGYDARHVPPSIGLLTLLPPPQGQILTKNFTGIQMSSPNPLFEQWLASYDGVLPLADVGCAYGVNTLAAARRGATVLALDCDAGHVVRFHHCRQGCRLCSVIGLQDTPRFHS